jgi:hypothetical protein
VRDEGEGGEALGRMRHPLAELAEEEKMDEAGGGGGGGEGGGGG